MTQPVNFDPARAVADAVLFEGYALYPYRPTSAKNMLRWQFGVLLPRLASETTGSDPWWMETQCLIEGAAPRVRGRLRFLRLRRRHLETLAGEALEALDVGGRLLVPWDEGELCEHDFEARAGTMAEVALAGDQVNELVRDEHGDAVARQVWTRSPLTLRLTVATEPVGEGALKLRIRVENHSRCSAPSAPRETALGAATLGTHLLLGVEDGGFTSLMDPPAWAATAATSCLNTGVYPVLAGQPGNRDLLLASPIILYDHPAVAPESPGDLFDATEIDEILTLRTLTLTDEEKRQARATDERVAALIDRTDGLSDELMGRLHGAIRALRSGETIRIGDRMIGCTDRVRLRPGARRTDAQDMFLDGLLATVREVKHDVDGRACLAVTVDDDPAADLHCWHGRYHYFYADEVEPVG